MMSTSAIIWDDVTKVEIAPLETDILTYMRHYNCDRKSAIERIKKHEYMKSTGYTGDLDDEAEFAEYEAYLDRLSREERDDYFWDYDGYDTFFPGE